MENENLLFIDEETAFGNNWGEPFFLREYKGKEKISVSLECNSCNFSGSLPVLVSDQYPYLYEFPIFSGDFK